MQELKNKALEVSSFGEQFIWGAASSAFQAEGSAGSDGRGPSIWDDFTGFPTHGNKFYDYYLRDLDLLQTMGIKNFRFSLSWPRILPDGTLKSTNQKGIDFYNNLIDGCLERGITPWVTLYHWDLPSALEKKGGWQSRQVMDWFRDYVDLCAKNFGDRVKHWIVMNEPSVFTAVGYYFGKHAPGKKGLSNFLPALHHALLCQAQGANILKFYYPDSEIGTSLAWSPVHPLNGKKRHIHAAARADRIINKLYLDSTFGFGYPYKELPFLKKMSKWMKSGDEELMKFPFDFIGVQNYTREVIKYSFFTPGIHAKRVPHEERGNPLTSMGWEIYPNSLYESIMQVAGYPRVKKIIITENGASFDDVIKDGRVNDIQRINFFRQNLLNLKKATEDGAPVAGYFAWSLTDNMEWAEGYSKRFGLVHIDYTTFERTVKDSGHWYSGFLQGSEKIEKTNQENGRS